MRPVSRRSFLRHLSRQVAVVVVAATAFPPPPEPWPVEWPVDRLTRWRAWRP